MSTQIAAMNKIEWQLNEDKRCEKLTWRAFFD